MEYFKKHQQPKDASQIRQPSLTFPLLYNILSMVFQFFLIFNDLKMFSYKTMFIFSQISTLILTMILPLTVMLFDDYSIVGYVLTCIDLLLQGFINAISFYSSLGICGFFPAKYIVLMSVGQAIAGIMMSVLNFLCVLTLPGKEVASIWLYFSITGVIMLVALFVFLKVYQDEYFLSMINNTQQIEPIGTEMAVGEEQTSEEQTKTVNSTGGEGIKDQLIQTQCDVPMSQAQRFFLLMKEVWVANVMCIICYIVTFTVYPNGASKPIFFGNKGQWKDLSFVTVTLIYNIFDTVGRKLADFISITNFTTSFFTLIRFLLFGTFPLNLYYSRTEHFTVSGIMLIINIMLLATSNGFSNTLCYALAPQKVSNEKKGLATSTVGFSTIVGIVTGTFTAFAMDKVFEVIEHNHPLPDDKN